MSCKDTWLMQKWDRQMSRKFLMWKRATPLHRQEARVAPPSPAGQLDPAGSAADSSGVKRAAPAPDSTAAKGIASRSGVGKLKRLDIKELWLQEKVRAAQLRIRKVGTEVNWADLGAKSLSGQRVGDLLSIMPLCRRGLVVACLLCCLTGVNEGSRRRRRRRRRWLEPPNVLVHGPCAFVGIGCHCHCLGSHLYVWTKASQRHCEDL